MALPPRVARRAVDGPQPMGYPRLVMSAPRIADRDLAPPVRPLSQPSGSGSRVGAALASPVGILLVVPGLVAAVGLFLTFLGQSALRESTGQLGRDRFAEQTAFIGRTIASSLTQADPLLDRMRQLVGTWSSSSPPAVVAHSLRGLMAGRPGIAYASISYPDGTFHGAYHREDGIIAFKEARGRPGGRVMRHYEYGDVDQLVLKSEEQSAYDPRTRDFYQLALATGRRVWTRPYQFFESRQTGVTRTEPVYERAAGRTLRAVLTADFDVHALSASMAHAPLPGARTLLYDTAGTVLAYPEGFTAMAEVPVRPDRVISLADLGDPVIDAFFARSRAGPLAPGVFTELSSGDGSVLAMVTPVPGFPELGWTVAAIVPREVFFGATIMHERQSLLAASLALLVALGVAVVFARHVVRVRQDAARARTLAREATDRARDLGSYRLIERLGQGGMGEVWRAEHRLLVRQAAIKLIRTDAMASTGAGRAELRERFRREAQTLATLRSRHTIDLFDYGVTEDGTFYFVMELLEGMDLLTLVERHGPQPPGRVIHLLLQVCSSLAEAHRAGLVHRDVKPANVFVCRAADEVDLVKVLDFGLVQAARDPHQPLPVDSVALQTSLPLDGRLTQVGHQLGTPAVMAPEQVRGEAIDGRADLYSLGCLGVWLLTGHMPFEGPSGLAIMSAHLTAPPPDLGLLAPGYLPRQLDLILRKCLEKNREHRPADAEALAEALRQVALAPAEQWTEDRARSWWAEFVAQPDEVSPAPPADGGPRGAAASANTTERRLIGPQLGTRDRDHLPPPAAAPETSGPVG
jgi:serine/threonine protein kinase